MIFLSLPLLYDNLELNNFLKKFIYAHQNKEIFNVPLVIESSYGSFPYSSWNGDVNNNWGNVLPTYNDFYSYFNKVETPARIDCSNIFLTEEDLYDVHQNVILEAGDRCGNIIEFSDLGVFNYLKEQYKNYFFIVSKNIDLIHPVDLDIVNAFTNQNEFYLFNLPNRFYNDEEFLKSLDNKFKIEINIGQKCNCNNFTKEQECNKQEMHNQIEFSGCSIYQDCVYTNQYMSLNIMENIKKFTDLGFSHFKIETPPVAKISIFNNYLIKNLVKPEYQLEFINDFYSYQGGRI